jgi:hypothetical protein
LLKQISARLYEYNEVLSQVNELGHVFGLFHFKSISTRDYNNKRIMMVANIVSQGNLDQEENN